jgi:hypothetical protein
VVVFHDQDAHLFPAFLNSTPEDEYSMTGCESMPSTGLIGEKQPSDSHFSPPGFYEIAYLLSPFCHFHSLYSWQLNLLENMMQHKTTLSTFKKIMPAMVATLCMTAFIVFAGLAFGVNALFNTNVLPTQAAPGAVSQASTDQVSVDQVSADQASVQSLQSTIAQYQQREAQYQQELQQAADQINTLNSQNQQYQQLIMALQNAGVIRITQDGRVMLGRGG